MEGEAPPVRLERAESRGAARVRHPGSRGQRASDLGDVAVGHAEDDEVGSVAGELTTRQTGLGRRSLRPGVHRGADPACADDAC